MGALTPEPMRAYQERVLDEILEALLARIRAPRPKPARRRRKPS